MRGKDGLRKESCWRCFSCAEAKLCFWLQAAQLSWGPVQGWGAPEGLPGPPPTHRPHRRPAGRPCHCSQAGSLKRCLGVKCHSYFSHWNTRQFPFFFKTRVPDRSRRTRSELFQDLISGFKSAPQTFISPLFPHYALWHSSHQSPPRGPPDPH